jgi:hypothetical protein
MEMPDRGADVLMVLKFSGHCDEPQLLRFIFQTRGQNTEPRAGGQGRHGWEGTANRDTAHSEAPILCGEDGSRNKTAIPIRIASKLAIST